MRDPDRSRRTDLPLELVSVSGVDSIPMGQVLAVFRKPELEPYKPRYSFTPLHLMLLLHYHVSCEDWDKAHAPAVIEYTQQLINRGLVARRAGPLSPTCTSRYETTDLGKELIYRLEHMSIN